MTDSSTFATVINCIDGRVQSPVSEWIKQNLGIDYVDMVTEPGPDWVLTQETPDAIRPLLRRVMVSIQAHRSRLIAIVGHHNCAANPVSHEKHLEQLHRCVRVIASWGLSVRILGLWVNEAWQVEVIHDTELQQKWFVT
jgi:carbonic anhydrase